MPPLLASAAIVLAFVAAPAGAVDEHHPEAAAGSTAPSVQASTPETGPTIEKMQENVRQMQSQLERAANAKTDDERRAALVEHMRTMQGNMMLGRNIMMGAMGGNPAMGGGMGSGATGPGMMGPGMMGPGMMSGMMGSGMMCPGMMGHGMMSPGMMGRGQAGGPDSADLQRMERRLDIMQMMMEQMMRSRMEQPGTSPSMPAR
ncbi:MAG: hypothetical protein H3C59_04330 [Burkholderiaceae bacterium]|nr:hypothetical protein [Burkholderiaceae bacterium]